MTPHVSITLLRTQTDERLIELIAAGHDRAFDAVVDRYRRPLLRYARRFLPEETRAEDVVQAAFVSAWGALRDGAPVRDLRPWLYRIVHNGALNVMKKPGGDDAQLIEASDLRPGPATEVEQREDVRQALDTIAALPDRQRAALLAVALDGRSHADVGEELGINDTAVRQLVSRARASLRVAATALTPWPVAVWLAGVGGAQTVDAATRAGEVVGGLGVGTLFGGGALKAGAVVAAAGAVAVGAPQVANVVTSGPRPPVASASASASSSDAGGTPGGGGPAGGSTLRAAVPVVAGSRAADAVTKRTSGGDGLRSDPEGSDLGHGDDDSGNGAFSAPGSVEPVDPDPDPPASSDDDTERARSHSRRSGRDQGQAGRETADEPADDRGEKASGRSDGASRGSRQSPERRRGSRRTEHPQKPERKPRRQKPRKPKPSGESRGDQRPAQSEQPDSGGLDDRRPGNGESPSDGAPQPEQTAPSAREDARGPSSDEPPLTVPAPQGDGAG